jgi:hypothetical protein
MPQPMGQGGGIGEAAPHPRRGGLRQRAGSAPIGAPAGSRSPGTERKDHQDHGRPVRYRRPWTARSPLQAGSTQKMSCNVIISRATRGSAMR